MGDTTTTEVSTPAVKAPQFSNKLRIFIIISIGLHLCLMISWGVPEYVKYAELRAQEKEFQRQLELRHDLEKKAKEEDKKQALEMTKQEVLEELKKDFDRITQGAVSQNDCQEIWNNVVNRIADNLNQYAEQLADARFSETDLENRLNDLKRNMVNEMLNKVRSLTAEQYSDEFMRSVEDHVVPMLADNYKKEIERLVGNPLQQEGSKIVRDEATLVEHERREIKNSLDSVVREADAVAKELAGAKDRIEKAEANSAQLGKDADDREAAVVKGEKVGIDQASSQIKAAVDDLNQVGAKLSDGNGKEDDDTAKKIAEVGQKAKDAAKNEGGRAQKETAETKDAAGAGKTADTRKKAGDAADAAKKLGEAIAGVKSALDGASVDTKEKKALKAKLDQAQRQADTAAVGLKSIVDRTDRTRTATETAKKTGEDQLVNTVKNEGHRIERAENTLKETEGKLKKAAERASAFGDDLKDKIVDAADNKAKDAREKTGAARQAAKDGKVSEVKCGVGEAADAAKKLTGAAGAAKDAADKARFDPVALARAVLKDMNDQEIKGAMDQAFNRGFTGNALPRLTEKLGATFKQSLDTAGINDDAMVKQVTGKIRELLEKKVPGQTKAGEASTGALEKGENLGNAKDSDKKNVSRVKAVASKTKSVVGRLANKEMNDLIGDASGDDKVVATAREHSQTPSGGHRGKKGKRGGATGAGGVSGAGVAEGEDSGDLTGLFDRVSNLAANVNAGRMGFLEGNSTGDSSGISGGKSGDSKGLGLGGKSADSKRLGLDGKGLGLGGKSGDGSGLSGLSRLRRGALDRAQGKGSPGNRSGAPMPIFNKEEHAKLTAGISERDQAAARGANWERKSAEGHVSTATIAHDIFRYSTMILPPEPKGEVFGEAQKKDPYKPAFKTINFAAVPFLHTPIKLDGDLAEWKDTPGLPMRKGWDGKSNPNYKVVEPQFVKVAWDNTGFYFAYDVKDADGKISKAKAHNFWEGDAVEVWFDALNTKDKKRGSEWAQQFWVWPFGMANDNSKTGGEAIMNTAAKRYDYAPYTTTEIQRAAKQTTDGWTMEVHIPIAQLKKLELQPGRIIGFNLSICTGTNLYYYWGGGDSVTTSERPDTWGDILLAGSDSKLELPDRLTSELKENETTRPSRALVIGEPLKIKLTDTDMNLSDKRRDKLSVTVKSSTGSNAIVVLEETSEKTGIFEGVVATTLNIGDPSVGTLALFEGELVDVIYFDQARANGARNVEVKLSIKAAMGMITLVAK
ncbi:MAG: sugar-binding protein [Planctomycetota bacterium]